MEHQSPQQLSESPDEESQGGGFTLVELMIVIAVIVILIALLIPAIGMARASSRQRQCASNLRNILGVWSQAQTKVPVRGSQWTERMKSYIEGTEAVLYCPEDTKHSLASSYALHDYASRYTVNDTGRVVFLDYQKTDVNVIGKTVAQLDSQWQAEALPVHSGRVNVAFSDGHVDAYEPRKIDPKYCDYFIRYWRPVADSNIPPPQLCVNSGDPPPAVPGVTTGATTATGGGGTGVSTTGTTTTTTTTGTTTGVGTTSGTTTGTTTGTTSTTGSTTGPPPAPCDIPTSDCAAADAAGGLLVKYTFDDPLDPWADSGPSGQWDLTPSAGAHTATLGNGNKVADMFPDGTLSFNPRIMNCFNTNSATICAWVKSDQWWVPGNRWYHLWFNDDSWCLGKGTHFVLFLRNSDGKGFKLNPLYNCGGCSENTCCTTWCSFMKMPGGTGWDGTRAGYIPTKTAYENWTHWAWVRDAATGQQTLYVNGVAKMSNTASYTITTCWDGATTFANYSIGTPPLHGWCDDFRIYKRALTPGELATIAGSPPE